jgi:uncharacterized protein with PQ loop repeat
MKSITKDDEMHPNAGYIKVFFDKLVYFFGVIIPILTLPQAYVIWSSKSAADVSVITWAAYLINGLVWLTYGILHREKPIIFTWILMSIINMSVVAGIILFR